MNPDHKKVLLLTIIQLTGLLTGLTECHVALAGVQILKVVHVGFRLVVVVSSENKTVVELNLVGSNETQVLE